jgi:hypothetical protein
MIPLFFSGFARQNRQIRLVSAHISHTCFSPVIEYSNCNSRVVMYARIANAVLRGFSNATKRA